MFLKAIFFCAIVLCSGSLNAADGLRSGISLAARRSELFYEACGLLNKLSEESEAGVVWATNQARMYAERDENELTALAWKYVLFYDHIRENRYNGKAEKCIIEAICGTDVSTCIPFFRDALSQVPLPRVIICFLYDQGQQRERLKVAKKLAKKIKYMQLDDVREIAKNPQVALLMHNLCTHYCTAADGSEAFLEALIKKIQ